MVRRRAGSQSGEGFSRESAIASTQGKGRGGEGKGKGTGGVSVSAAREWGTAGGEERSGSRDFVAGLLAASVSSSREVSSGPAICSRCVIAAKRCRVRRSTETGSRSRQR